MNIPCKVYGIVDSFFLHSRTRLCTKQDVDPLQ